MRNRYAISLYLPLYDNSGKRLPRAPYDAVRAELVETFGGVTAYQQAPITGLWKPEHDAPVQRDSLVIYEVLSPRLNRKWWDRYRRRLEALFRQEELLVRASKVKLL